MIGRYQIDQLSLINIVFRTAQKIRNYSFFNFRRQLMG